MSHFRKIVLLSGLAGATLVLSGCVVAPAYPYRSYQSRVVVTEPQVVVTQPQVGVDVEYVQMAPPAPYAEVVTVSPGVGYVWLGGEWIWSGGRHHWRSGSWARPPAGRNHWQSGGWNHRPGRGWQHQGGHWR